MKAICLKNGTIITDKKILRSDILIFGKRIKKIGSVNMQDNTDFIDASGCFITPGFIDIHTHLDDKIGNFKLADNYRTGSTVAVLNGITTLGGFITQKKNDSLYSSIVKTIKKAKGNSYTNLIWHLTPNDFTKKGIEEIKFLIENGFRSFKLYTTYKNAGIYSSYKSIENFIEQFINFDITLLIHCEDDKSLKLFQTKNKLKLPYTHCNMRPEVAEFIAVNKILKLFYSIRKKSVNAQMKIHFVHISSPKTADLINKFKKAIPITSETAPHYLFLNNNYLKRKDGYKWLCSPPLRNLKSAEKLSKLAIMDYFDIFSTDHCAFKKKDKDTFANIDISKIPNGVAGIGALPHLIFKLGFIKNSLNKKKVNKQKILKWMVQKLSYNPASLLGINPQKGIIAEGSDADINIIQINNTAYQINSSLSDVYETYPGFTKELFFKNVFVNGKEVVRDNKIIK